MVAHVSVTAVPFSVGCRIVASALRNSVTADQLVSLSVCRQ